MLRRTRHAFGALVISLTLVAQAQGQAPQVDPNSPAGTEYELPLDRARQEAGAGGGTGGSAGDEAPLFGQGLETATAAKAAKSAAGSGTDSAPATISDVEPHGKTAAPKTVHAQVPAPDGGGTGLLAVTASAGGVILLGALAGLMWRRRSSPG